MSGAVRSMTGFATATGTLPDGQAFSLSVKGVNHRFLDLQLRLPAGCDALEMQLRRLVREQVGRGHLTITMEVQREGAGSDLLLNEALLDRLVEAWRTAGVRVGLPAEPELGVLLRHPGVLTTERSAAGKPSEDWSEVVLQTVRAMLGRFDQTRRDEGVPLLRALRESAHHIQELGAEIRSLRQGVKEALFARLERRMTEVMEGRPVNEERLLLEAALLVEKSDVEEEAVRIHAHADRFLALLDEGGAVGKQLDFLLQELQREANTTLSKMGSAAGPQSLRMTELGLAMKAEIERAREQAQNVE